MVTQPCHGMAKGTGCAHFHWRLTGPYLHQRGCGIEGTTAIPLPRFRGLSRAGTEFPGEALSDFCLTTAWVGVVITSAA